MTRDEILRLLREDGPIITVNTVMAEFDAIRAAEREAIIEALYSIDTGEDSDTIVGGVPLRRPKGAVSFRIEALDRIRARSTAKGGE